MRTMGYEAVKKAIAEGKALEMRKYRQFGEWGNWKPVTGEKALRKIEVSVGECGDCPYDFRLVKD